MVGVNESEVRSRRLDVAWSPSTSSVAVMFSEMSSQFYRRCMLTVSTQVPSLPANGSLDQQPPDEPLNPQYRLMSRYGETRLSG